MSKRWNRQAWVAHALEQLAARGPEGVTLDHLCTSAGRTRGSLYHHFPDHGALLTALVAHWRQRFTEDLIANIEAEALEGLRAASRLNDLATALDFDTEVNIRRLVANRPALRDALAAVDERRIAYLAQLRREAGASEKEARMLAELEYAAFIGVQHLAPMFTPKRLATLYRHLDERLRS